MAHKEYTSHIDEPEVYTTSKGSSYVKTFDVVRSTAGRELIRKHAAMATSLGLKRGTKAISVAKSRISTTKKKVR